MLEMIHDLLEMINDLFKIPKTTASTAFDSEKDPRNFRALTSSRLH
jgi:hypothetical protein